MQIVTAPQYVRLGDILDIRDGTHDTPRYVESGIPLITSKNLTDSGLSFENANFISENDHLEISKRSGVNRGDVLYGMIGTIGKPTLVDTDRAFSIKNVALFKHSSNRIDARYLLWLLQSQEINRQIESSTRGGTQKFVSLGVLRDLRATVPTVMEQRRIAAILDKADALRTKRREALAQLDRLAQSIFVEMFGDPATNPKGWPKAVLGELIHSASDGPHVSPKYAESGVPFLSTRHVRPGEISWDDLKFIDQIEAETQWKKCRPTCGDILYTKGGTTGFAAEVKTDQPFAVWVHVALLKPNSAVCKPTWLESMLNSNFCYRQSQELTHGIANRDLGLKRMVKILMYRPPLALQDEFIQRVEHVNLLKGRGKADLALLESLFASLQHRAFRGEL